jgi:hypothetical protein
MKFLFKNIDSEIYKDDLVYKSGTDNSLLKFRLLNEQKNFCAYTETYIQPGRDSTEVEHFDPSKKDADNYFNYYATLRSANERKIAKYKVYKGAQFFETLFFHDAINLKSRIVYNDFTYETVNENDKDAKDFIDYLGFNDDYLYGERIRHIDRLKLTLSSFSDDEKKLYFQKHKGDLSYITAIEAAFNIDLSEIINN